MPVDREQRLALNVWLMYCGRTHENKEDHAYEDE